MLLFLNYYVPDSQDRNASYWSQDGYIYYWLPTKAIKPISFMFNPLHKAQPFSFSVVRFVHYITHRGKILVDVHFAFFEPYRL